MASATMAARNPDRKRDPRTDDEAAQQVATEGVGAHRVLEARSLQDPEVVGVRVIRSQNGTEDGDQRKQGDDGETRDRLALVSQAAQQAEAGRLLPRRR